MKHVHYTCDICERELKEKDLSRERKFVLGSLTALVICSVDAQVSGAGEVCIECLRRCVTEGTQPTIYG